MEVSTSHMRNYTGHSGELSADDRTPSPPLPPSLPPPSADGRFVSFFCPQQGKRAFSRSRSPAHRIVHPPSLFTSCFQHDGRLSRTEEGAARGTGRRRTLNIISVQVCVCVRARGGKVPIMDIFRAGERECCLQG